MLDLFRRDLTYWECSFLSNSPSSFCHPWKKLLNKSDLMFLFLEDTIHGETSSFAPGRTVAVNMNYSVSWGWQENVRSGHLSGDRNHQFPSSFCWSQRYHMWCDPSFAVQQGLLTVIQLSGKVRNSFSLLFIFQDGSECLSVLPSFMGNLFPRNVEMDDPELGFCLLQLGGTGILIFHWYSLELTPLFWISASRSGGPGCFTSHS